MGGWREFLGQAVSQELNVKNMKKLAESRFSVFEVYPASIHAYKGVYYFIAKEASEKVLVAFGDSEESGLLKGNEISLANGRAKICSLNNDNCKVIRSMFPFTCPISHKGRKITMGLGDRLGLASAGHIRLLGDYDVFPVLAQQSMRELNLTGRTYEDVLSAASWSVFQEGYEKGFGADGDHLKTMQEVQDALDFGFTMITLDCSEYIRNDITGLSDQQVDSLYSNIPVEERERLESKYSGKSFDIAESEIKFSLMELKRYTLIYLEAIRHTVNIFFQVIVKSGRPVDFEISIDETQTPTSPEAHYFVARELLDTGIDITSLAPRFCGEFQKGIDYRGDLEQFSREFEMHTRIAKKLEYKLSIHSGSDKFAVFPVIGEKTGGVYHIKTAGTNWLEAVRLIAAKNPGLYRRMHEFALKVLPEAKKYYHIGADPVRIAALNTLSDTELPSLMDADDSRQVLHITYGLILLAKNSDGGSTFRGEIYKTLNEHEDGYYEVLGKHIGKHIDKLGIVKPV